MLTDVSGVFAASIIKAMSIYLACDGGKKHH
jgi:hypothetical protein